MSRPFAPPDHSDLAADIDPRPPVRVGDRVAWVTLPDQTGVPRARRGRTVELLGRVIGRGAGTIRLWLDDQSAWDVPPDEVHPRPGR